MSKVAQLGQLNPDNTTAVSIFSPADNDRCTIHNIIICNVTGSTATYRIFVDNDGTTYDTTTAIAYDIPLAGNSTTAFEVNLYMTSSAGNLAVRSGTGDALTFTVNGTEAGVS